MKFKYGFFLGMKCRGVMTAVYRHIFKLFPSRRQDAKIDESIIRHAYSVYSQQQQKDAVKIYEYSTMFSWCKIHIEIY